MLNKTSLKVVNICSKDFDEIGTKVYSLHSALKSIGVDSQMLVLSKSRNDNDISVIEFNESSGTYKVINPLTYDSPIWEKASRRWLDAYGISGLGADLFSDIFCDIPLDEFELVKQADVLHFHWLPSILDLSSLQDLCLKKKIFFSLHDMNPFTGGCHFSHECFKFMDECGSCPQLGSSNPVDISKRQLAIKKVAFECENISVIAYSKWMAKQARKSKVMKGKNIFVVPNIYLKSGNWGFVKEQAVEEFSLNKNKRTILFNAEFEPSLQQVFNKVEKCLSHLSESIDINSLQICVMNCDVKQNNYKSNFKIKMLGLIEDVEQISKLYGITDVVVQLFSEQYAAYCIIQALSMGTPVVAFDRYGISEIVTHKYNGFLSKFPSERSLADGITWLLEQDSEEVKRNCFSSSVRFAPNEQAKTLKEIYVKETSDSLFNVLNSSFSKWTDMKYFISKSYDVDVYGYRIDPSICDLKVFQDLFVYAFVVENVPKGSKLLEIGGGDSRVLRVLANDYECWNLDKLEGIGSGLTNRFAANYKMVYDYIGHFSPLIPNNYFDFIFSISTLEHIFGDNVFINKVCEDIERVSKEKSLHLHLFDSLLNCNQTNTKTNWRHPAIEYFHNHFQVPNEIISAAAIANSKELWSLHKDYYDKFWKNIVGLEFEEFGTPYSDIVYWEGVVKKSPKNIYLKKKGEFKKISIVTPSFNQAEYLESALDSVLSQGYPNLEYTVLDGGSTDNSIAIIKKYERFLTRWESKPDGGQYAALNNGLKQTKGEIMGWLNSDDMLHPDSLFVLNDIFSSNKAVKWATGRPTAFDQYGNLIFTADNLPNWSREKILAKKFDSEFIQQESTYWVRELWNKAGGYISLDSDLIGDFELWLRFSRIAKLFTIDALVGGFRYHSKQKTASQLRNYVEEVNNLIESEIRENKWAVSIEENHHNTILYLNDNSSFEKTKNNTTAEKDEDSSITLITSINPKALTYQDDCIETWTSVSKKIYSFNSEEEISILCNRYPNITFIPIKRDGKELVGKPLVFLEDIIAKLDELEGEYFGYINADIYLNRTAINMSDFIKTIQSELEQGMLYSHRIDVELDGPKPNSVYDVGYDLFFFKKNHVANCEAEELLIGMPWWDYYLLFSRLLNGVKISRIEPSIVLHRNHVANYNSALWYNFGRETIKLINRIFNRLGVSEFNITGVSPDHERKILLGFAKTITKTIEEQAKIFGVETKKNSILYEEVLQNPKEIEVLQLVEILEEQGYSAEIVLLLERALVFNNDSVVILKKLLWYRGLKVFS